MNSFSTEQQTKIQQNRYILYFFIAIFFILPAVMVMVDLPLLKAAYYTRNGSVSTSAKVISSSEYMKATGAAHVSRTYDIEYEFQVPNQGREFIGKDRLVSDVVPYGMYKIRYNPSNPNFSRLENPYYTNSKIYVSLAIFGLAIFSTVLASYCVYKLSFSRLSQWLLAFGYGSLLILVGLLTYFI